MFRFSVVGLCIGIFCAVGASLENEKLELISRSQWAALPPRNNPTQIPAANLPLPFVVVHHSAVNNNCSNEDCAQIVRNYQNYHMLVKGWNDIGYNFLIAPDGDVFEGRGWGVVGAHAAGKNSNSVGICLIGNFEEISPTEEAITALQELIKFGVDQGKISPGYKVVGHKQVRNTLCPGENLFSIIKTWSHWSNLN